MSFPDARPPFAEAARLKARAAAADSCGAGGPVPCASANHLPATPRHMISSLSSNTSATADFFSRIDTNSDGQVSADELKSDFETHIKKAAASTTDSSTPSAPDYAQMISDGDTDGDGTLSEVEFTTAMQARRQMPPPPPPEDSASTEESTSEESSIEDAISTLDTDGDGKLSAAELAAAYVARDKAAQETESDDSSSTGTADTTGAPDFASLVSLIDTDGDGLLNSDEISTLVSDSRRAQQPPPPPPMPAQNVEWETADTTTESTTAIGQA